MRCGRCGTRNNSSTTPFCHVCVQIEREEEEAVYKLEVDLNEGWTYLPFTEIKKYSNWTALPLCNDEQRKKCAGQKRCVKSIDNFEVGQRLFAWCRKLRVTYKVKEIFDEEPLGK